MRAIRVKKSEAEGVRKWLEKIGAKDRKRLIVSCGDYVEIPIIDEFDPPPEFQVVIQKNPVFSESKNLLDLLSDDIPPEKLQSIPRRYKIIGDLILIKLPSDLYTYRREIGSALLKIHRRCRAVWLDSGKEGMIRKPRVELIAGKGSETIHRENGVMFRLDVTKVMFSPGNLNERIRISRFGRGEVVVDMFAGIGYFSIPMAVHSSPEEITAIEINPDAFHYLRENIELNHVEDKVIPVLGDSMEKTPENYADRVIMGHLFSHKFLPVAIKAIRKRGIIHYHEGVPERILERPAERIKRTARELGRKVKIRDFRKVKNYSPGVWHVVVDAEIH